MQSTKYSKVEENFKLRKYIDIDLFGITNRHYITSLYYLNITIICFSNFMFIFVFSGFQSNVTVLVLKRKQFSFDGYFLFDSYVRIYRL